MEYINKTYRFDEQVTAWLEKLKSMHGSYNKGLRLVAFPGSGDERAKIIEIESPAQVPAAVKKLSKKQKAIQERAQGDVTAQAVERNDIDYSDVESTPTTHVTSLDATGPTVHSRQGKISMENWRAKRHPLLKPKEQ